MQTDHSWSFRTQAAPSTGEVVYRVKTRRSRDRQLAGVGGGHAVESVAVRECGE